MRTEIDIRVYFEDTDFTGVVYHANYLRFFERGRSDGLRQAGLDHRQLLTIEPPIAFTVRSLHIDYFAPARIDDLLRVETVLTQARGERMIFRQFIYRDVTLLAKASVEVASMDLSGKPRRLPAIVLQACNPTPLDD